MRAGRFELRGVLGTRKPADIWTKPHSAVEMRDAWGRFRARLVQRRSWVAAPPDDSRGDSTEGDASADIHITATFVPDLLSSGHATYFA